MRLIRTPLEIAFCLAMAATAAACAQDPIEPAVAFRPAVANLPDVPSQTALPTTESDAVAWQIAMIQAFGIELAKSVGAVVQSRGVGAYPTEARREGTQGQALVRVQFAVGGRLERLIVDRSSGSPTLDEAALALVKEAMLPVPDALRSQDFTVSVPMIFRLVGVPPAHPLELAGVVFALSDQGALKVVSVSSLTDSTTTLARGDEVLRCARGGRKLEIPREVLRCGDLSDRGQLRYRFVVRRAGEERTAQLHTPFRVLDIATSGGRCAAQKNPYAGPRHTSKMAGRAWSWTAPESGSDL